MLRPITLSVFILFLAACSDDTPTQQAQHAEPKPAVTQGEGKSEPAASKPEVVESTSVAESTAVQMVSDGTYALVHKFAEHPNMPSIAVEAVVKNGRVSLFNHGVADVFPKGLIKEGELFWHAPSKEWVIIVSEEDKQAEHVGGCTDGPEVIDFNGLVYWTC